MKISKEFKIGVFVLIAFGLLFIGYNYMSGFNLFKSNKEYVVFFKDVRDLTPSNPVKFRGVKIGLVKSIDFVGDNFDSVKVTIAIDHEQFLMKTNTKAELASDGFLGGRKIDLTFPDTVLSMALQGDTLIPVVQKDLAEQVSDELAPLKKKTDDLVKKIDDIVKVISEFWKDTLSYDISTTLNTIQGAMNNFKSVMANVNKEVDNNKSAIFNSLANIQSITKTLRSTGPDISETISNIKCVSDSLCNADLKNTLKMIDEAFTRLNLIVSQVNNGEGSLGNLIYSDSLYQAFIETNANLQMLVEDIRNYPSRYVHFSIFGSRVKAPKLNSKEEKALKQLLKLETDMIRTFTNEEMDSLKIKVFGDN